MTTYTVIGAGGFIGRCVVDRLKAAGRSVVTPERGATAVFEQDLGRVIYCAGLTGDYRSRPFATVEAHVTLLAQVLARAQFERIVYLSSTRVYDALPDGEGREDRPIPIDAADPRRIYELSKMLGENLVANHAGGRGCAARLSYVFDWADGSEGFLSEWLLKAAGSREISLASSPSFSRDYIHRQDVADALIALADSQATGIINLAGGETLSNTDLAEIFARHGWRVRFESPSATDAPRLHCDTTRLSALGVRPRDVRALIETYLAELG